MTKDCAQNGPSNAGSSAGPNAEKRLDTYARKQAQLLPQRPPITEAHRHAYPPVPPPQQHAPQPLFKPTVKANRPKWKQG